MLFLRNSQADMASAVYEKTPAAVRLLFVAYILLGCLLVTDYGLSWDEPFCRLTGAVTYKYLYSLLSPEALPQLADIPLLADYKDKDYGVAFELPIYALERWFGIQDLLDAYTFRHWLTFLFSSLGVMAIYSLGRRRFSDWRYGLAAAVLFVLSPRIFAESFYNTKDIVFMTSFAIAISTMLTTFKNPSPRNLILHGLATAFSINVRIMSVIILPMTLTLLALQIVQSCTGDTPERRFVPVQRIFSPLGVLLRNTALYLGIVIVTGVAIWPWLWDAPWQHFTTAFANMSKFRANGYELFFGANVHVSTLSAFYIPAWIWITTPLLYSFLFLLGCVAIAKEAVTGWRTLLLDNNQIQDCIFLALLVLPVAAIVMMHSILYNGWRHVYFVYPYFILVAIRGMHWAFSLLSRKRILQQVFAVIILASLGHTGLTMVMMHPLQNVYFNLAAGTDWKSRFPVDYWGLGVKPVLQQILTDDPRTSISIGIPGVMPVHNFPYMLTPKDRARLTIIPVDPLATLDTLAGKPLPDYLLTNYYENRFSQPPAALPPGLQEHYTLLREIRLLNEPIYAVYALRK